MAISKRNDRTPGAVLLDVGAAVNEATAKWLEKQAAGHGRSQRSHNGLLLSFEYNIYGQLKPQEKGLWELAVSNAAGNPDQALLHLVDLFALVRERLDKGDTAPSAATPRRARR